METQDGRNGGDAMSDNESHWTEMHTRFDQDGQPWIVFKRVGIWWAVGMHPHEIQTIMRRIAEDENGLQSIVTDYKYPNATRYLGERFDAPPTGT